MILRKIFIELNITTSHSDDNLIVFGADDGLGGSDEEHVAASLCSDDWDSYVQILNSVLDSLIELNNTFVTFSFRNKWNRSSIVTME